MGMEKDLLFQPNPPLDPCPVTEAAGVYLWNSYLPWDGDKEYRTPPPTCSGSPTGVPEFGECNACGPSGVGDCNGLKWENVGLPFITFPGSPIGMPFFFDDLSSSLLLHTDITFKEGKAKKHFRIIPPFNEEILRDAFRNTGFPLNASEVCEFYRHRPPYQCFHTHTVTTR